MQNILDLWQSLAPRRRAMLVGSAVAVLAGLVMLWGFASRPGMALLYSGLDSAAAGEVLAALDQQGAVYEVRGAAIYVDSARRDALRMGLAAEGLPASQGSGYELLDSLSGFGTTSQMFDAAYWRAKEGELARTITTGLGLRSARVHIANPSSQGLRARTRPSASVTVSPRSGSLGDKQARALRYLVASGVPGMAPEDVAVIDAASGLLLGPADEAGTQQTDEREEALRLNVQRLVEARVGPGNAVVELAIEPVSEREAITERRFDPQSRVAISTDTQEKTGSSSDGGSAPVTVASNLPTGDAAQGDSKSQNSETRERVNFEVSETTREVLRTPGAVRRLSVAVLVNGIAGAADSTTFTPRTDEELAALRELVASAVGFDEGRGDVITVKSMQLEPLAVAGTDATPPGLLDRIDPMTVIQIGTVGLVTLILGLFVLRPILAARPQQPRLGLPSPAPAARQPVPVLTGEIDDDRSPAPPALSLGMAGPAGRAIADPAAERSQRLRDLVTGRQSETAEILRGWMNPAEEGAA